MTALTITHQIAAPLEVIPQELGLLAQNLVQAIAVLTITDAGTFEAGNGVLMKAHATGLALEKRRKEMTAPINDLKKQIDAVVASVAEPLETAKRTMQGRVAAYQRQEQAKADALRREAEERARIEREAAEKERARLQAVADELHRQQVAEATAKAASEAKELEAILGKPVEAEPVKVAAAPVIEAAKVMVQVVAPAPVASAVQTRKVQKVEFTDRMLVPVAVGGFVLRPIDEAAVRKALLAGAVIPGAVLVEVEQLAMARA